MSTFLVSMSIVARAVDRSRLDEICLFVDFQDKLSSVVFNGLLIFFAILSSLAFSERLCCTASTRRVGEKLRAGS